MCRSILTTIGILLIWVVVGTVLQLPYEAQGLIFVVATSIWAGFDASKIEFKKYKTSLGSTVYGGGGVFAAVLLLWIIFFPWYLFSRNKVLSGKAKLRDENDGNVLNGVEIMEENKKCQSITREDAIEVLRNRRKKDSSKWFLLVIVLGLSFFLLSFHVVTFTDPETNSWDFTIVAKDHLSFSNTIVNVSEIVRKYNEAVEEYNAKLFSAGKKDFDETLRQKGIDPVLRNKLVERGIIVIKDNYTEELK